MARWKAETMTSSQPKMALADSWLPVRARQMRHLVRPHQLEMTARGSLQEDLALGSLLKRASETKASLGILKSLQFLQLLQCGCELLNLFLKLNGFGSCKRSFNTSRMP